MQEPTHALAQPQPLPAEPPPGPPRQSRKARKQREQAQSQRQDALLNEYFATLARLRSLQEFFNRITDSDLISSCVYEMNAVQQRYAYLLGRLKEENVTYLKLLR